MQNNGKLLCEIYGLMRNVFNIQFYVNVQQAKSTKLNAAQFLIFNFTGGNYQNFSVILPNLIYL